MKTQRYNTKQPAMKNNFFTRREIAQNYFPDCSPRQAVRNLSNILNHEQPLLDRLRSIGYRPGQQWLSPRMLDIIFQYLGVPWLYAGNPRTDQNGLYPNEKQNWQHITEKSGLQPPKY